MRLGGQAAVLAIVTVAMCMVAALTGFAFMKLSERDSGSPGYTVTDVSDGTGSLPFDGTVSFESFDESSEESVLRFSFSVSVGGHDVRRSVTVIIDNGTGEPFGFRGAGGGLWTDDDGTVLETDGSGGVTSVTVVSDGLAITARRSP